MSSPPLYLDWIPESGKLPSLSHTIAANSSITMWSISTASANPETVTLVSSVRLTIPDQRSFNISPSQQSMKFSVWNSCSPFYTNKICIKTDLEIFANCTSVTIMESRVNDDEADSFMLQPRYNGTFFYTPYQLGRMFHRLITIHGHLNPPLSHSVSLFPSFVDKMTLMLI